MDDIPTNIKAAGLDELNLDYAKILQMKLSLF
jgi:hypothetical protein